MSIYNKGNINICTSVDKKYLKHLIVMMNSVFENTNSFIVFFVLNRGLLLKDKNKIIKKFGKKSLIIFIDMDCSFENNDFFLPNHIRSKSAIDRLLLTSILKDINKVIYLDVDLVVNSDLSEIYNLDTGKKGICARICNPGDFRNILSLLKIWGKNNFEILNIFPEKIDEDNKRCFNSGVMILDLDKMRKNNFENSILKVLEKYSLPDQLLLNLYTNGKHTELPIGWNYFPSQDYEKKVDKHIVHWIGPEKPWNSRVNFYKYWFKYSDSFWDKVLLMLRNI